MISAAAAADDAANDAAAAAAATDTPPTASMDKCLLPLVCCACMLEPLDISDKMDLGLLLAMVVVEREDALGIGGKGNEGGGEAGGIAFPFQREMYDFRPC